MQNDPLNKSSDFRLWKYVNEPFLIKIYTHHYILTLFLLQTTCFYITYVLKFSFTHDHPSSQLFYWTTFPCQFLDLYTR